MELNSICENISIASSKKHSSELINTCEKEKVNQIKWILVNSSSDDININIVGELSKRINIKYYNGNAIYSKEKDM